MEYLLNTRFDSRQSFYGKAKVIDEGKNKKLYSYGTLVAEIKNNKPIIYGWFSCTTARHINEFLLQNGFNKMSKKEMEEK